MKDGYIVKRDVGIMKCSECLKRGIATHTVNVGLLCGQQCVYCSSPSRIFRHSVFKELGVTAFDLFDQGIPIVDPWTPIRIAKKSYKLIKDDIVLISAQTDPYDKTASKLTIGRRCIEAVLRNTEAKVKILTKSTAIINDLDLLCEFKERVSIGFSIMSPVYKSEIVKCLEPGACNINDRLFVYKRLHDNGIKTFGMVKPCMPGIINGKDDMKLIFETLSVLKPEFILVEPVSLKWNNILKCSEVLATNGHTEISRQLSAVREKKVYDNFIKNLISGTKAAAFDCNYQDVVKIAVNSDGDGFDIDDSSVIWLKR